MDPTYPITQVAAAITAVATASGALIALLHARSIRENKSQQPPIQQGPESSAGPSANRPATAAQAWQGAERPSEPPEPVSPPSTAARRWYQENGTKPNGWPFDPPPPADLPAGKPDRWWLNPANTPNTSPTAPRRQVRQ